MGDIKRKQKLYSRPRQLFNRPRIEAENVIVDKYGLKNKREIWKAEAKVSRLRRIAKHLIPRSDKEKQDFFEKLNKKGFKVNELTDVLALTTEDWLGRRLQTLVYRKGLAKTVREARQMIVHKKVLVNGAAVNIPSFFVSTELENLISLRPIKKKSEISKENIGGEEE